MTKWYVLDENNDPVEADMFQAAEIFEDESKRHVGQTTVGGYTVSTVFLMLDHNFSGIGAPILFESMIFGPNDEQSGDVRRYCTWDEAAEGHEALVHALQERLGMLLETDDAEELLGAPDTA